MGVTTEPKNVAPVSRRQRFDHQRQHGRHRWVVTVVILLLGMLAVGGVWWHSHQQSVLKAYPIRGVSIDQDDGYIDFHQLQSAGVKFVYLKATSGASYIDDNFSSNYERVSGTTLQVGIYEEFSFSSSAEQQYRYMVSQIGQQSGNLPIAIHITDYGKYASNPPNYDKQGRKLARLVELLSERYGQGCIIWAGPQIQKKLVMSHTPGTKRWTITDQLKRQSSQVKFMQYTGNEKLEVGGKKTDLVISVFNGSRKEWKEEVN